MHLSTNLSPTLSRCRIEVELEGKSDTGLSPPNSNDKAMQNLELRLTPPTRDSASLCRTNQNNTSPHLELRLTPQIRDSASLSSNLYVTVSNINKKSRQKNRVKSKLNLQDKTKYNPFLSRSRSLFPLFQDRCFDPLVTIVPRDKLRTKQFPCHLDPIIPSATTNHRPITQDKPNHRHLDDSSTLLSTPEPLPRSPRLHSHSPYNDVTLVAKSRRRRQNLARINY